MFRQWVPLIVWLVIIFTLPNAINLISGGGPDLPKRFDKVVHFGEYLILALLLYRGLGLTTVPGRALLFCAVVAAGLAVGALDEFTQYFIPFRDSSIRDWFADAAGVFIGALSTTIRAARPRKETRSR
jgi:VanZ family protein